MMLCSAGMPGTKSRWRRVLIPIGIAVILLGLVLLALPVWFPWLARPVARSIGVKFDNYRRMGFARFEMTGITGRFSNVEIAADRFEAFLPHSWLWYRWRPGTQTTEFALATDWLLRIVPTTGSDAAEPKTDSTLEALDEIDQLAPVLRDWLPMASLRHGTLHIGDWSAVVPEASWNVGQLQALILAPEPPESIAVRLDASRSGHWRIHLEGAFPGLEVTADLVRNPDAWDLVGAIDWRSNRVDVTAQFNQSGWLPSLATISGSRLAVPPELHGLSQYGVAHGELAVHWSNEAYTLVVQGQVEPVSASVNGVWPPLALELNGHGNLHTSTVDTITARAPWFSVELRNPVNLDYSNPAVAGPAVFDLQADLSGLGAEFQGLASAEIAVRPGTNTYPTATLRASSTNLLAQGFPASDLEVLGSFHWPLLELEDARVTLGSNSTAQARGVLDLQNQVLQAATFQLQGDDLHQFLPEPIGVEGLRARVQAAGPLNRLSHQGEIQVSQLTLPPLNPLALSVDWQGEAIESATYGAQVSAEDSRLLLEGRVQRPDASVASLEAQLDVLTLENNGQPTYRLDAPARLRLRMAEAPAWQIELDAFAWKDPKDRLLALSGAVRWPTEGQIQLTARHVNPSDARDFWPGADLPITLPLLNLMASWTNAPLDWHLESELHLDNHFVIIDTRARGDAAGISVETLTVRGTEAPSLVGQGRLPLIVDLAGPDLVRLLPDAPLEFTVSHKPVEALDVNLGAGRRLELARPSLDLRLQGTVNQPRGEMRASLTGANWHSIPASTTFPKLENARLEAEFSPELVQLKQLEFMLEGQTIAIQGEWPLGTNTWTQLLSQGVVPDGQAASARVLIEEADLSPVAQHIPTLLSSQGKVSMDLNIQPGMMLDGFLALTNAMTRPLGPLAPVRDIEAIIAFNGRTARVDRFTGRLGGRPIYASGHATLSDAQELLYTLRLQGTNAPLLREPGLLMRANLDLTLQNQTGQNPSITGAVQLRDGLLLQDVGSLLVNRLERPALRPPYFSVTNLPFARWQLDVKVSGDRFLRVRSPAFIGAVSADGLVQGSLEKPVIQADVRIPSGRILFPFGKLDVERAYATLSEEEPRGPKIDLISAGHNYGYNVRLEVNGTMDTLNVLFTSTPPLSSEDILLMLTAGELPNQEITYSAEARAGRLITYLGREVATRFFGNEMGEERLTINSGENIARSGRTTYSIEYRLTPRWSLVGEYDEFNALNAGLKLRIFSR
jgi:translocation and assembly module TamB